MSNKGWFTIRAAEWTVIPVKRWDASIWLGLAYISDGEREYGSFNEQQAIAICKAHNAATAKLHEALETCDTLNTRLWAKNAKLREENERLKAMITQYANAIDKPS